LKQEVLGTTTYALCNSGKPDASFPATWPHRRLFAHFPMLFHPHPQNVSSSDWPAASPPERSSTIVERLDVVDINEQVVAASDYFREWNNDVLSDQERGSSSRMPGRILQ